MFSMLQDVSCDILVPFSMTASIKRSLNTKVSTIDIIANLPTAKVSGLYFIIPPLFKLAKSGIKITHVAH